MDTKYMDRLKAEYLDKSDDELNEAVSDMVDAGKLDSVFGDDEGELPERWDGCE